ncbi:MAG: hypothetical protein ABSE64_05865 [Vulcanimicrobiaceae bacterium]|jgi:hypothetical protein
MSKNVADAMWELLSAAGVRRCYGIVGDALNPTISGHPELVLQEAANNLNLVTSPSLRP